MTITANDLKEVTQIEIAALLGVSEVTIRKWSTQNFDDEIGPFPESKKSGTKNLYNYHVCRDWYVKYKLYTEYKNAFTTANGDETLEQAKTRKESANATLAELELAASQKKLIPAKDVEKGWSDIVMKIRSKLMSMPSRMSILIHGNMQTTEIQDLFDTEIRTILLELSETNVNNGTD